MAPRLVESLRNIDKRPSVLYDAFASLTSLRIYMSGKLIFAGTGLTILIAAIGVVNGVFGVKQISSR